ncbi:hypothetical protein [Photobacterium profundum]
MNGTVYVVDTHNHTVSRFAIVTQKCPI